MVLSSFAVRFLVTVVCGRAGVGADEASGAELAPRTHLAHELPQGRRGNGASLAGILPTRRLSPPRVRDVCETCVRRV
jgi:hypothetical protein